MLLHRHPYFFFNILGLIGGLDWVTSWEVYYVWIIAARLCKLEKAIAWRDQTTALIRVTHKHKTRPFEMDAAPESQRISGEF